MLFGEGAGGFRLAQPFVVRGVGGQAAQGFFVVGASLATGLFEAAPKDFGIVLSGEEIRSEPYPF